MNERDKSTGHSQKEKKILTRTLWKIRNKWWNMNF
jgi:hypothetical protein